MRRVLPAVLGVQQVVLIAGRESGPTGILEAVGDPRARKLQHRTTHQALGQVDGQIETVGRAKVAELGLL